MASTGGNQRPVLRASGAVMGGHGTVLIAGILRGIIAARLVSPTEFGTYVVAAAFLGFLEVATQPGLQEAVVAARHRPEPRVLRTVWTLNIARGLALAAATFIGAPYLAALVRIPEASAALQLLALVPLLRGLQSLEPSLRQRETRLGLLSGVAGMGAITGLLGTAVGGWILPTAVGLSIGLVVESVARVLVSYTRGGFVPGVGFALRDSVKLVRFASWRFGSNLVTYASMNLDDLVVGRLVGPAPAGGYRIGYRLSSAATADLPYMLGHVMLPTFRQMLHAQPGMLRTTYVRYAGTIVAVGTTLAFAVAPVTEPLIVALLGADWRFVTGPFLIFLGGGIIRAVLSSGVPVFLGCGEPRFDTTMQAVRLVALIVALVLLAPTYGLMGAAWASAISAAFALAPWAWGMRALDLHPAATAGRLLVCVAPGLTALSVSLIARLSLGDSLAAAVVAVPAALTAALVYALLVDRRIIRDVRWLAGLGAQPNEGEHA